MAIVYIRDVLFTPYTESPDVRERAYRTAFKLYSATVQRPNLAAAKALASVDRNAWPCPAAHELADHLIRCCLNGTSPGPDLWGGGDPEQIEVYVRTLNSCYVSIHPTPKGKIANG